MKPLSDATVAHLRRVADWPDLSGTRYEIVELIGQGGMGTVYRARDLELEREVALKVLRTEIAGDRSPLGLRREAKILARLEHPGIVPIHDVGVLPDGRTYYIMKLIRGTRLDEYRRTASRANLLRHFLRICDAVSFAHANGVIHRDLKPTNIMVGPFGEVLVLDWGVAKLIAESDSGGEGGADAGRKGNCDTGEGAVIGTPGFMAPEQAAGESGRVDPRADVYALGEILRWLAANPPRPLAAISAKALAVDPRERYPTVKALADEVARFLDALPVEAYRESPLELARRLLVKYQAPILLVLAYLAMRILFLVTRGL